MGKSSKFWWNQINQFSLRVHPSEGPNFIWLGLLADYFIWLGLLADY